MDALGALNLADFFPILKMVDPQEIKHRSEFCFAKLFAIFDDFRGQDFELIPFSSGRRLCPGMPLANRMLHLMKATLIHNFNWKFESRTRLQELDINEKFGLALSRVVPLKAVPSKYEV
ncbi:hypothetical protein BUALT_Bualt10G0051500 [Buddleja alternifolia]|uniref:Cytochrome P450 n=1 Tax=Buddleja alternifolia TaxID=168488 RepID=A0AAV6X0Z2_9LAMI|nr:hypothetical protein BUALT_Bualt10G0051500 [Buddleja alternifolia]